VSSDSRSASNAAKFEGSIPYTAIESHEELCSWSRSYCAWATRGHELEVDLRRVDFEVSTRSKRRAGAVKYPSVPAASVGTPYDWTEFSPPADSQTHPNSEHSTAYPTCTVSLTYEAFQTFERSEWTEMLRHELVHVEQFQQFGTTNHGQAFERRTNAVDASTNCPRFATPPYRLECQACETVVARRYRDCPLVRNYAQYQSACCASSLRLLDTDGAEEV